MNYFENNPLGKVLAAVCGGLAGVFLLLVWAWNWPVGSGYDPGGADPTIPADLGRDVAELGPVSEYRIIDDRPVFNETRQPVVALDDSSEGIIDIVDPVVAEAPNVRLTGVVITPDSRFATFTPSGEGKPIIAREGIPLEGQYVGWTVVSIHPRAVDLVSQEGEALQLELAVHDQMIKEPPRPEPPPDAAAAGDASGTGGAAAGQADDEQLTRAEEIRQRIAERRAQLRAEATERRESHSGGQEEAASRYQQALQGLINRRTDQNDESETSTGSGTEDD